MRPFEWVIIAAVAVITVYWALGRRPALLIPGIGTLAALCSVIVEKPRVVMLPAYLVVVIALIMARRPPATAPPRRGWLRITGSGVLGLLVLALGIVLPWVWPVIQLPRPTGPHPIGTTWLVIKDTSRTERFGAAGQPREFPVEVWYPAAPGARGRTAPYALPEELGFGMIPNFLVAQIKLVRTHAIPDVPMAEGLAPVLIFSHGYSGYPAQNTPQMEELASRGYVVASIAHVGETAMANFPDGRRVPMDTTIMAGLRREMEKNNKASADPQRMMDSMSKALAVGDRATRQANFRAFLMLSPEPLRTESVREWALDTKATLDRLEAMNKGAVESPFKDRLDLGHVGVFGMSYGGATAGEFCKDDARCKAAINIDGGQYGTLVDDSLMVPFLIIGSAQAYGVHVPELDLARGPAFLIKVPETNHVGLTDMSLQGPIFKWAGMTGKLDPDRREAIMTAYTVGFFEKYLMGRNPELWDSLPAKFPEVAMTRRN